MNVCNLFRKPRKVWRSYQQTTSVTLKTSEILSGQNHDMLYEVALLCLRIQETFELEAL